MKIILFLSLVLLIEAGYIRINANMLKKAIDNKDFYVIDTREMETSVLGYIPNTIIIPRSNFTSWLSYVVPDYALIVVISDYQNYRSTLDYLKSTGKYKLYGYVLYEEICRYSYFNPIKVAYAENTKDSLNNIIGNKGSLIVDVRETSEFVETGVIETSQLIPFSTFMKNYVNIPQNRKIYMLCKKGLRAVIAMTFAKRAGLTNNFFVLERGIEKTIEEGYPLVPFVEKKF